jgi:MOSC domain-containing protein YiiM
LSEVSMVPKPFLGTGVLTSNFSSSSVDEEIPNSLRKKNQKVLGIYGRADGGGNSKMPRARMTEGMFVPLQGLVGHDFWHVYSEEAEERPAMYDRAVLIQSIQNYRKVADADFVDFPQNDADILQDPRFGEQVIVDTDDDICLGDVYELAGSTLKIRVTAPRKSTRLLDMKNRTPIGMRGISHFVCSKGMGGWFCEVLCEGSMHEGSELVLVERPLPKWTLLQLATAVYGGEGDPKLYFRRKPSWGRTKVELEELLAIPYLSDSSWKEILRKIKRQENEKRLPTPYFDATVVTSHRAVASVLGVYARGQEIDEYMPRSQVPEAFFAPTQGIEGSMFWHLYDTEDTFRRKNERAVLIQSIQAYRRLQEEKFEYFPDSDMAVLIDPCFGEQMILDIPGDVCLGDVYGIQGSTLKMRVTSPRKPCSELDKRNDAEFGSKGLRHFTTSRGLAGWFCEVLIEGTLSKGSIVELLERPFPKWTMQEISMAIYGGEGDPRAMLRACASWGRPIEQLHQLLSVPYFAEYEWKDELREVLAKSERKKTKLIPSTCTNQTFHVYKQRHLHGHWTSIAFASIFVIVSSLMVLASSQASDSQPL